MRSVRLDMTMRLPEVVKKYLAVAGGYGKFVTIASLQIPREETERVFDFLDEDYHISRFFHFRDASGESSQDTFLINGFPQTHISIDSEIQAIL
jgi:hypothetical protein